MSLIHEGQPESRWRHRSTAAPAAGGEPVSLLIADAGFENYNAMIMTSRKLMTDKKDLVQHFLRSNGVSAWLVFVNFLGDKEMGGPTTPETWEAAYQVAFHVMGLRKDHLLSRFMVHTYPSVSDLSIRAA